MVRREFRILRISTFLVWFRLRAESVRGWLVCLAVANA